MKKLGTATDPVWYKDAIIYELHVRAFADSNNDGIGDFPGLMSRLDYLQELGVTCIWLLPFFPSPGRDDGYDIADYNSVNPSYGTLDDFKAFLDAAHGRGMQVMIELVINHTSDQHPWFKAARLAPPGSPERAMYVWSDTDRLYDGVRIIFTDTEKSNWTWDDQAKQFYWHRFFSHQPDLNFDNPRVMEEVLSAMRFWLDMGVDALRLDAIPYLVERDGTSCENVPETHVKIKEIRKVIDEEYANRLILAEANMWPADVRPYFGDGDECHMAFHFPLMPRIYMALRQEDRLPITDIMAQTPDIPPECQWGIFLRNHDELTLEMVTDDERDYMNLAYAADTRMRINVGIRRRLAPLMDNNRRRIELLNSLLLSFPGTPIMYYGDEIGMGDNIYLGDRNGVRTPMQWNSDRNAGFSKCDPARLYFPVIMDPTYGYQVVNVEAQQSDQSSLLHWTRNMIALRKLFQVFGRGTLKFLHPENRKVLAYLREYTHPDGAEEKVLCVANLSRFAQPAALDLKEYAGMLPVEMLGYVSFPAIGTGAYPLTVAPYSFLWFELQPAPQPVPAPEPEPDEQSEETGQAALDLLTKSWAGLLAGGGRALLEAALTNWLPRQRWFGAKTRSIDTLRVTQWAEAGGAASSIAPAGGAITLPDALLFCDLCYTDGSTDRYQVPLTVAQGAAAEAARTEAPASTVLTLRGPAGSLILLDAATREELRQSMLNLIAQRQSLRLHTVEGAAEEIAVTVVAAHTARPAREVERDHAEVKAIAQHIEQTHRIEPLLAAPQFEDHLPGAAETGAGALVETRHSTVSVPGPAVIAEQSSQFAAARGGEMLHGRTGSAEQSNTNFLYGQALLMKVFRRLQPGENPDVEIGRFLTEVAHFPRIAPFLGEIRATEPGAEPTTLAMLQGLVTNEGDGWSWTLDELGRYYESVSGCPPPSPKYPEPTFSEQPQVAPELLDHASLYLNAAALLGRRTAEMHLALATPTDDPAFAAEPMTADALLLDARRIDAQINLTLDALRNGMSRLKDLTADDAATLLSRRIQLFAQAHAITGIGAAGDASVAGQRIRIHGDYHLGQILRTRNDFVMLDFEGEPARKLAERRRKQSPLKDVAGMLRSFSYAAWAGLDAYLGRHPDRAQALEPWARVWERAVASEFLRAYRSTVDARPGLLPEPAEADRLLAAYLLEKALYELLYELNNRPDWIRIPLAGILSLPQLAGR